MPRKGKLRSIISAFFKKPFGSDTSEKKVAKDSSLEAQSSIAIPRTSLSKGAAFGEAFTKGDLQYAVEREPMAYKMVFQVAHDIFDKWFTLTDPREEGKDEDLDAHVQVELSKLNAKDAFTQAAVYERAFGWSIIIIGYKDEGETLEDEKQNPESIEDLAVIPTSPTTAT